ncbi:hypothetical protein N8772_04680 [Rickettsiales bacterium]|nr:hypothetical protein [Rickettsiales bacterium]MDB2550909.1 hypothetical protein [Rickettsiales bacterium]
MVKIKNKPLPQSTTSSGSGNSKPAAQSGINDGHDDIDLYIQDKTILYAHGLFLKLQELKPGDIFAIELDIDGCLINGCIVQNKNSIDKENPLNQEVIEFLEFIKKTVEDKGVNFHLNLCSSSSLYRLPQEKLNPIIKKLCALNNGPIVQIPTSRTESPRLSAQCGYRIFSINSTGEAIFTTKNAIFPDDIYCKNDRGTLRVKKHNIALFNKVILEKISGAEYSAEKYIEELNKISMLDQEMQKMSAELDQKMQEISAEKFKTDMEEIFSSTQSEQVDVMQMDNDPMLCRVFVNKGAGLALPIISAITDQNNKKIERQFVLEAMNGVISKVKESSKSPTVEEVRETIKKFEFQLTYGSIDWVLKGENRQINKISQLYFSDEYVKLEEVQRELECRLKGPKDGAVISGSNPDPKTRVIAVAYGRDQAQQLS